MSVYVSAEAWRYSNASGNDLIVLLALSDHANDEDRECWPSVALLAKKCRLSRATIQRSLRELERLGEISIVQPGGGRFANRYRIHPRGLHGEEEEKYQTWPQEPENDPPQSDTGLTGEAAPASQSRGGTCLSTEALTIIEPPYESSVMGHDFPFYEKVMEVLNNTAKELGIKQPNRKTILECLQAFPARDHLEEAHAWRVWALHTRPKVVASSFRNWLKKAQDKTNDADAKVLAMQMVEEDWNRKRQYQERGAA